MRSRQEQEFGRTLDRLSTPPFEAASRQRRCDQAETQPMRALSSEAGFLVRR